MDLCPENALIPVQRKIGTLVHKKAGSLDFVEGRIEIGEPSAVPLIRQTKEYLEQKFPRDSVFILDCPPGNSCPVMESIREVDYVILVAEPTPFGYHDMKIAIDTLKVLKLDFGIVINKSGTRDHLIREYCANNRIRLLGSIKNKKGIAERIARGELLIPGFPTVQRTLSTIYLAVNNRVHVT
jgi:MinD superfamily P-loop ATPase